MDSGSHCSLIPDEPILKPCGDLAKLPSLLPDQKYEFAPCQKVLKLQPEDEISLDSLFSDLLSLIEPVEEQFKALKWNLPSNVLLNEKQAAIFEETLYISRLKGTNCKLSTEPRIFLERELEEIGSYTLNIEESYDGFVVFSNCKMNLPREGGKAGHYLKGKYDNRFLLICEKRMEYTTVDKARITKILEVRNDDDHQILAYRETRINHNVQKFKSCINTKGRERDPLIFEGGIMLLIRWLVINNFTGEFHYYSLTMFGRMVRCVLTVEKERKDITVFYRSYKNLVHVVNVQYSGKVAESTSETYYKADGHMVLHFWHEFGYVIHDIRAPGVVHAKLTPKLELTWRQHPVLLDFYHMRRKLNYDNALAFLTDNAELADYLHDYISSVLKFKPVNILSFSLNYFQSVKGNV